MSINGTAKLEEAAAVAAVMDVHCRERGILPSSDEAGMIAGVVEALVDSGICKPDDIRAALLLRSDKDSATTLHELRGLA